jgi:hypothetical protein
LIELIASTLMQRRRPGSDLSGTLAGCVSVSWLLSGGAALRAEPPANFWHASSVLETVRGTSGATDHWKYRKSLCRKVLRAAQSLMALFLPVSPGQVRDHPEPPAQLLDRLLAEPATEQLTADDWGEGVELIPGMVVEIDAPISDWFAENLDVIHQGAEHFLGDDGQRATFSLWHRDGRCYVRFLTAERQAKLAQLAESAAQPVAQLDNRGV